MQILFTSAGCSGQSSIIILVTDILTPIRRSSSLRYCYLLLSIKTHTELQAYKNLNSSDGMVQNVIVICLDSVRKDIYEEEMKKLKRLVDIEFDGCRAPSSWSVPSHASFLTGQLPSEHGVHSHNIDFGTLNEKKVLTHSGAFENSISISANQFTSAEFDFDHWFDQCLTLGSTSYYPSGLDISTTDGLISHISNSLQHEKKVKSLANGLVGAGIKASNILSVPNPFDHGASAIQNASESVIQSSDEPCFLFTNFMEAHHPHRGNMKYASDGDVPNSWSSHSVDLMDLNKKSDLSDREIRDYLEKFRTMYKSSISYLDDQLYSFIKKIQRNTNSRISFIITADHGENLGYRQDDNLIGHTASLSEGLLHVPFGIINPPSGLEKDDRIFSLRSLPNIIRSIIGDENFTIGDDRYIEAELIGGGPLDEPDQYWDRMIRAVYDNKTGTKVIWDSLGNAHIYQVGGNPSSHSKYELIEQVPDWATVRFETEIKEYKQIAKKDSATDVDDLQAGTKDRLEDLGYL